MYRSVVKVFCISYYKVRTKESKLELIWFYSGFFCLGFPEVIYCHSQPYNPEAEAGLNPLDETLAILWPTALSEISDRDRKLPKVTEQSIGILDL